MSHDRRRALARHEKEGAARDPDDENGPDRAEERFLRPFAVAAGDPDGTGPGPGPETLDLLTLVVAARTPGRREWLRPEREAILRHALRARTVVELAAEVNLPVGQVRAIAARMIADGSLQRCGPSRPLARKDILHAVLVGLRSL
ncbi:DUF742 domain-containing protein [Nocardiopsis protaetiae]|uniref:DUF742 domain-containing protein n=1 Tax=Nocardiopsis protaetiae TaxID=3382270 RepID=UPI00387AFB03